MAFLEISDLQKFYGTNQVVKDFNLGIEHGEFVSFLGPSGCGKTTTLRMVAGFETPSDGVIRINGQDVVNLRPNQRNIGMVFQSYALFPNMTVAQNVGFGLRIAKTPKEEARARVEEMLTLVGLRDFGARFPFQLSGGQQQRVALARALAGKPQVLLLDEPLSALDAKIRVSLREEIRQIQRNLGITTIYVTHDQEEALSMSDRIVVMNAGVAEQVGKPFEIYNHPSTRFVAGFVGTLNTLEARAVDPATGTLDLDGQTIRLNRPIAATPGDVLSFALRPEIIRMGRGDDSQVTLKGVVDEVSFLGSVVRIRLKIGDNRLVLDTFNTTDSNPPSVGETCEVSFPADSVLL